MATPKKFDHEYKAQAVKLRMCIWKHWKKAKTKIRNLRVLGVSFETAYMGRKLS